MRTLAVLTIGQAPRPDLTPELRKYWPGITLHEHGALDGMTESEIETLAPGPDEEPLTSRLIDGSSAVFGAIKILPYLSEALVQGEAAGADATLLVCGSEFPAIPHTRPLLRGSDLLHYGAAALCRDANVGVIRPLYSQLADARRHWTQTLGRHPNAVTSADPYCNDADAIAATASRDLGHCDIVILDCFGYDEAAAVAVARRSGLPTLLTRSIVARLAAEFMSR